MLSIQSQVLFILSSTFFCAPLFSASSIHGSDARRKNFGIFISINMPQGRNFNVKVIADSIFFKAMLKIIMAVILPLRHTTTNTVVKPECAFVNRQFNIHGVKYK